MACIEVGISDNVMLLTRSSRFGRLISKLRTFESAARSERKK